MVKMKEIVEVINKIINSVNSYDENGDIRRLFNQQDITKNQEVIYNNINDKGV